MGILWMCALIVSIYAIYNGVFVSVSIISSPSEMVVDSYGIPIIQNFGGRMSSIDVVLGVAGMAMIISILLCQAKWEH